MMFPASPPSPASLLSPVPDQVVKSGLILFCPQHNVNSVFSLDHSLQGGRENFNPGEISHPYRFPHGICSSLCASVGAPTGCGILWKQWWYKSPEIGAFLLSLPWDQAEPLP